MTSAPAKSRSSDPLLGLVRRIDLLDSPKRIMEEICRELGRVTDFCCFLRLRDSVASGQVYHCRPPLPDYDIDRFSLHLQDEPSLRHAIEQNLPISLDHLSDPSYEDLLQRRRLQNPLPLSLFPIRVGPQAAFIFYADRQRPFNAIQINVMARLVTHAGLRFEQLVFKKRGGSFPGLAKREKRPVTRLMGMNWMSALIGSEGRLSKATRQQRTEKMIPALRRVAPVQPQQARTLSDEELQRQLDRLGFDQAVNIEDILLNPAAAEEINKIPAVVESSQSSGQTLAGTTTDDELIPVEVVDLEELEPVELPPEPVEEPSVPESETELTELEPLAEEVEEQQEEEQRQEEQPPEPTATDEPPEEIAPEATAADPVKMLRQIKQSRALHVPRQKESPQDTVDTQAEEIATASETQAVKEQEKASNDQDQLQENEREEVASESNLDEQQPVESTILSEDDQIAEATSAQEPSSEQVVVSTGSVALEDDVPADDGDVLAAVFSEVGGSLPQDFNPVPVEQFPDPRRLPGGNRMLRLVERGTDSLPKLMDMLHAEDSRSRYLGVLAFAFLYVPQTLPELAERLFDPAAQVANLTLHLLHYYRRTPEFEAVVNKVDSHLHEQDEDVQRAIAMASNLRAIGCIPSLIELLSQPELLTQAHAALQQISCLPLGTKRREWRHWWESNRDLAEEQWYIEALGGKDAALATQALQELEWIAGTKRGFFDLKRRRDRRKAQKIWNGWWKEEQKSREL